MKRNREPFSERFEIKSDDPYKEYIRFCEGILLEMEEDAQMASPSVCGVIRDYTQKVRQKEYSRPALWMRALSDYLSEGGDYVSKKHGERICDEIETMITHFETGMHDPGGLYDLYLFWKRYFGKKESTDKVAVNY